MSFCAICRKHYTEPEGEAGDHPCPICGRLPHERERDAEEPDDREAEG